MNASHSHARPSIGHVPRAAAPRTPSASPATNGVGATPITVALVACVGTLVFAIRGAASTADPLEPLAPAAGLAIGTSDALAPERDVVAVIPDARAPLPTRPRGVAGASPVDAADEARAMAPIPASVGLRTESEHLVVWRDALARDAASFEARARAVVDGSGPASEILAVLRVAHESTGSTTDAFVAEAIATLSRDSTARRDAVADPFVLRLAARAPSDVRTRDTLERVVWTRGLPADPLVRVHALRALVAAAPEHELARLAGRVHGELDTVVQSAGLAALDERSSAPSRPTTIQETP